MVFLQTQSHWCMWARELLRRWPRWHLLAVLWAAAIRLCSNAKFWLPKIDKLIANIFTWTYKMYIYKYYMPTRLQKNDEAVMQHTESSHVSKVDELSNRRCVRSLRMEIWSVLSKYFWWQWTWFKYFNEFIACQSFLVATTLLATTCLI